jgi:beta-N-acetylglucosaminidase
MAKYSEKAGEKVEKTMHEVKEGKLKSGSGKKVTSKNRQWRSACLKRIKKAPKYQKRKADERLRYRLINITSFY